MTVSGTRGTAHAQGLTQGRLHQQQAHDANAGHKQHHGLLLLLLLLLLVVASLLGV
jgi:hypothetical protein